MAVAAAQVESSGDWELRPTPDGTAKRRHKPVDDRIIRHDGRTGKYKIAYDFAGDPEIVAEGFGGLRPGDDAEGRAQRDSVRVT